MSYYRMSHTEFASNLDSTNYIPNLTDKERKVMKALNKNDNIKILPVDKGSTVPPP